MKSFLVRNRVFLVGCIFLYMAFLTFLSINERDFLYFPDVGRPDIPRHDGVPQDFVVTTEDDLELTGLYWPPTTPQDLTLVFFHGNAQDYGFYLSRARDYTAEGYGFLVAEYRGFGGNPGAASEQGLYQDARAYITALHEREGVAYEDMVLLGFSLGSGVAVQMATEYPAMRALILQAFYNATSEIAKLQYWMFPVDLVMQDQYRSIDKIGDIKMPVFMVHGERDTIIPVHLAQALYEAAPQPKTFIRLPQAGHNDLYFHGTKDHTLAFLAAIEKNLQTPE